MKGYEVKPKYDNKNGKLVGYTIGKNASVFKASAIGRRFMMSQLEATWKKMHPKPTQVKMRPAAPSVTQERPARPVAQTKKPTQPKVQPKVQPKPESQKTLFSINTGSEAKQVWIPNSVKDIFLNEAQIPEGNNMAVTENISHVAMLLSTVSSKFRPYHFFIAVKPPAFFASSRESSTSTTILRPTCVMAASITPLFLMRFAVGMLHLKTFAKPSIPYS